MAQRSIRPSATVVLFSIASVLAFAADGTASTNGLLPRRGAASPPLSVVTSEVEILPTPTGSQERAGTAVAIDGDFLLVGVPGNDRVATGRVRAYHLESGSWRPMASPDLPRPTTLTGAANFGESIAMSGNRAVVGAPRADRGAAFVYELDAGVWGPGRALTPPAGCPQRFGISVAIDAAGNVAVGAIGTGEVGGERGAVAIYAPGATEGVLVVVPGEVATTPDDRFGASVAIDGDALLVGAPFDDTGGTDRGSAFFYDRADDWTTPLQVQADPSFSTQFGTSVALAGARAVVGAPYDGTELNDNRGAVYVYERMGTTWPATGTRLIAEDAAGSAYFGTTVALDGERLLVGAPGRDGPMLRAGGAYLFERRAMTWTPTARMQIDEIAAPEDGRLGDAIDLGGDWAVLGAPDHAARQGYAAVFAVPSVEGSPCSEDDDCESSFCTDGRCCSVRCDADCLSCATGECIAADEGMACTSVCGAATCSAGSCGGCDAGTPVDDGGEGMDAGVRTVPRVSGCKCAVGAAGPSPGASCAAAAFAALWLARRLRRAAVQTTPRTTAR